MSAIASEAPQHIPQAEALHPHLRRIAVRWPWHRYVADLRGSSPQHLPPAFVPELAGARFEMLSPRAGPPGATALPVFGPEDDTYLTLLLRNFTYVFRDFEGSGPALRAYGPVRRMFDMLPHTAVCFSKGCAPPGLRPALQA